MEVEGGVEVLALGGAQGVGQLNQQVQDKVLAQVLQKNYFKIFENKVKILIFGFPALNQQLQVLQHFLNYLVFLLGRDGGVALLQDYVKQNILHLGALQVKLVYKALEEMAKVSRRDVDDELLKQALEFRVCLAEAFNFDGLQQFQKFYYKIL